MNRLSKILIIPLLIVMVFAFGMSAFAELHTKWVAGDQIYFDSANIWAFRDDEDGVKLYDDLDLTFGTGNDATIEWDADGTEKLILTCSNGFTISGAVGLTGALTVTGTLTVTDHIYMTAGKHIYFRGSGDDYQSMWSISGGKLKIQTSGTGADDLIIDGTISAMDNITFVAGKYLYFRGTTEYIYSISTGKIKLMAAGTGADDFIVGCTMTVNDDITMTSGKYVYLRGITEYVVSDGASNLMLNAATTVSIALGGSDEYDFSSSTLAMNANTITECGDIDANDAAGPSIIDETVTATNPTICPNKTDDHTGLGWEADTIHIVLGASDEYDFSTAALEMNDNNLTEVGTYSGTGAITLDVSGLGTFLDFVLETSWVSGTLINADFASATTLTGAAIGIALDFTAVHVDSDQDIKLIDLTFPDLTFDDVGKTLKGIEISGDTITQTTGSSSVWTGIDITIPTMIETAGTLTAIGVKIVGGTCTTDPITYGIALSGIFETAGIALSGTYTASGITIGSCVTSNIAISGTNATGIDMTGTYSTAAIAIALTTPAVHAIDVTITDPTDTTSGVYAEINSTDNTVWSGGEEVCAIRGKLNVATLAPGDYGTGAGGWFELVYNSALTADGVGLTTGVYVKVENQIASKVPCSVLYLEEETTGSGVSSTMAMLVFASKGTEADKSRVAIAFGFTAAGADVGTGTSEYMYYGNTIRCKINNTLMYLPFSTAEASFTTAYPIDVSVAGGIAIDIGTSTTGIDFTGTVTDGIKFANATLTQGLNNAFIDIGTYTTQKAITVTDVYIPIQVNLGSVANPGSPAKDVAAMRLRVDNITQDQAYVSSHVIQTRKKIDYNVNIFGSIQTDININAAIDVALHSYGVLAKIRGSGALTGSYSVLRVECAHTGGASGTTYGISLDVAVNTTLTHGIAVGGQATSTLTNMMYMASVGTVTNVLKCVTTATNFIDWSQETAGYMSYGGTDCTDSGATDPAGTIRVLTPGPWGSTGYIRVWAAP